MSLSTVQVISEPFKFAYFFGPERQSRRYEAKAIDRTMNYKSIAKSILNRGTAGDATDVIFVKDMAFYLKGRLEMLEEWFHDAKHSFLIRDPNKAIISLFRVSQNPEIQASGWDYFDPDEAGYQELHEMYEYVKTNIDADPVVVDADDLLSSPKKMMKAYCQGVGIQYEDHMTSWKAGEVPAPWIWDEACVSWYSNAVNSSGFIKEDRNENSSNELWVTYPDDVVKAIEDNRPFYEKLYSARVRLEN